MQNQSLVAAQLQNAHGLQLVGLDTEDRLCVPAWQDARTGTWNILDDNPLAEQRGLYSALRLGHGNQGSLQVVGLDDNGEISLAAWQDSGGTWHPGVDQSLGIPGQSYTSLALGNCAGLLQVFGLASDGRIYACAHQDAAGHWHSAPAGTKPLGDPGREYVALEVHPGHDQTLQVVAAGRDGHVYRVADQDDTGAWHVPPAADSDLLIDRSRVIEALAAGIGNDGHLQIFGLDATRHIFMIAWQDRAGKWHQPSAKYKLPFGKAGRRYSSLALGNGHRGHLQLVGLGTDGKAYLVSWQDGDGVWHQPSAKSSTPLGDPELVYTRIALGCGAKGTLQVAGIGSGPQLQNGLPYLVAWQDTSGAWKHGQPLYAGDRSAIVNWQGRTGKIPQDAVVAFGRLWVTQGSAVVSYDAAAGAPSRRYGPFGTNAAALRMQAFGEYLAVYCDDCNLYIIDLRQGGHIRCLGYIAPDVTWMGMGGQWLFLATRLGLFRVTPPDRPGPWLVEPSEFAGTAGDPSVAGDVIYVPWQDGGVAGLDVTTLLPVWTAKADAQPETVATDGTRLCFTTANRDLHVYDIATCSEVGKFKLPADIAVVPVLAGNRCFVALVSGLVLMLDVDGGQTLKTVQLSAAPRGRSVLSTAGVLYYATEHSVVMIDASTGGSDQEMTYTGGPHPCLAAHRNGALLFADAAFASSIRLGELIHQFYAESTLIRDFDFSQGGVDHPASAPNYQVEIHLFDKDGTPRPDQELQVTASAQTFVNHQGGKVSIGPDRPLRASTDSAGRLRLAVPAGTFDKVGHLQPGLTAPELLVTSTFMDPNMRFVIRPHGPVQGQLATIKADQLYNAKGYDKLPSISTDYLNDPTALGHATSAINQSAGVVQASMSAPRKRGGGTMYCDPSCDMTVACCMPAQETGGGVLCTQCYTFDLTPGASHFRLVSAREASGLAATMHGVHAGLGGWNLDKIWDDIRSGTARFVQGTIEAVADGVKATIKGIVNGGAAFGELMIDTIEKATLLVQGLVNTIMSKINRVIEALSFLFDWGNILSVHETIKSNVNTAWDSLYAGKDEFSFEKMKTDIRSYLDGAKSNLKCSLDKARKEIGSKSPLAERAQRSPDSAKGGTQGNWLMAKFQDHALPSGSGVAAAAPGGIEWPTIDFSSDIKTNFSDAWTNLKSKIGEDGQAILDNLSNDLDLQADPGLLARGMAVAIDLLEAAGSLAITAVDAVIEFVIDLVRSVFEQARAMANKPLPEIPFLSDFYRWATNQTPTLLDIACLIIAIPAAIACQVIKTTPAYASGVSPDRPVQSSRAKQAEPPPITLPVGYPTIFAGVAQVLWAGVSAAVAVAGSGMLSDAIPGPKDWVTWSRLALCCVFGGIVRGLFLFALLDLQLNGTDLHPAQWCLFAFPTAVIAADIVVIFFSMFVGAGGRKLLQSALGIFSIVFGFAMIIAAVVIFFINKKDTGNILNLIFNIVVGVSFWCKAAGIAFGLMGNSPWQIGAIAVTSAATAISGVLEIARGYMPVGIPSPRMKGIEVRPVGGP